MIRACIELVTVVAGDPGLFGGTGSISGFTPAVSGFICVFTSS